ncbi:MAG: DUF6443 domain-containing protein [Bacteroidota bacterium]
MNIQLKRYILTVAFLMGYALLCNGQGLILNNYGGQSQISDPQSIRLTNGFYVPNGSNVRIFITPGFTNCITHSSTPSTAHNYTLTRTFKVAGVNEGNINTARNICQENHSIQYFDGLGRSVQNVEVQASPQGQDIVQPLAYDAWGREKFSYLNYSTSGSNGTYRSDALQAGAGLAAFYNPSPGGASGSYLPSGVVRIPTPSAETNFEASPLNRAIAKGAPGDAWQLANNHIQQMDYGANNSSTSYTTTGFAVRLYTATPVAAPNEYQRTLGGTSYYAAGQLSLTISKDENWMVADGKAGTIETYTDKMNRVVLKRNFNKVGATIEVISTYYVYDDFGNLSFVLPPGTNPDVASVPTQTVLDNSGYQYRYDDKKRLIEKRVPSKGWEYMVYNKIDQVVFTQDANQRTGTQWTFTKYDAMGREILTGLYTDGSTRLVLQASVTASVAPLYESRTNATATGYSNVALPTSSITNYWVQSYYDDYDFLSMGTTYPPISVVSYRVKGLLTGKKVFQTNLAGSYWTMYYYDDEGREKETYAQNQLNGYDRTINTYNFASELTNSIRTHVANADTTTIANTYHYDHRGRSIATTSNINNQGEVVLNRNYYNEIGQLNQKNLHSADAGSSYLQASLLRYNERGWLSSSSSNPFSFQLNYNDGTTPQYNGNVANQLWGAAAVLPNTFTYGYDKLNRLTSGASTGIAMSEAMAYDLSGNIIALTRDALSGTYNYSGNRLTGITGTLGTGSYVYDANGNATTDGRNGVALVYNFLNLPTSATKTGLNLAYTYSAEGVKLRRTNSTTSTTTDYVEGIQYSNNVLQFIQTTEGRAANVSGTYIYEYDLKDHLGNVRLTFRKVPETGVLAVLQKDDYYPFGKQKIAINGNNKYLYNSKELQEGLEQYDYGARFYDPVIGRWLVVDPMGLIYPDKSPYIYALNNPISYIDPDGMQVDDPKPIALKEIVIVGSAKQGINPFGWQIKTRLIPRDLVASRVMSPKPTFLNQVSSVFKFFSSSINILKSIADQQMLTAKTPEEIIEEAEYDRETSKGNITHKKKGTLTDAEKDFEDLVTEDSVTPLNDGSSAIKGKIGRTPDGRTVIVRDGSNTNYQKGVNKGDPTLEIRNTSTNRSDKIRYNPNN